MSVRFAMMRVLRWATRIWLDPTHPRPGGELSCHARYRQKLTPCRSSRRSHTAAYLFKKYTATKFVHNSANASPCQNSCGLRSINGVGRM